MVTGVTGRSVVPPDQSEASLARKRVAATAFFRDEAGRVLLVNPGLQGDVGSSGRGGGGGGVDACGVPRGDRRGTRAGPDAGPCARGGPGPVAVRRA
jgi:hypothetical protein